MKIFIYLILFSYLACSQIIKSIELRNLQLLSSGTTKDIIGIKERSLLDKDAINKSIHKLYAQGYFEDIYVTYDNETLTYHFKELPTVAIIEVKGYGKDKEKDELYKFLGVKKGDIYNSAKINQIKKSIKKELKDKGYHRTVIGIKSQEINKGSIKLIIDINKGEKITIKKISYCGVKNLSKSSLEGISVNRQRDFLGWMIGFNDGALNINQLDIDRQRMREYYLRNGYLSAKISKPYLEISYDKYEANIAYKIQEGNRSKVLVVDNEFKDEKPTNFKDFIRDFKIKVDDYFDVSLLREDMQMIKDTLGALGYAFAKVNPNVESMNDSQVIVTYEIIKGQKVKIQDIIISGNSKTLDTVIRREMLIAPGDIYNSADIQDSKNALQRLGYFESVEITEKQISDNSMNIIISLKELSTGELSLGFGYASSEGLIGSLNVKQRNIFGSGQTLNLSFDKSSKSTEYRVNIINPRVFDSLYSLSTSAYRTQKADNKYNELSIGLEIGTGRKITRHLMGYITYSLEQTTISNIQDKYKKYYKSGVNTKSSISPSISFDNTDNYFFARKGNIFSSYIEFAGIGGNENYIKNVNMYKYHYDLQKITNIDLIFRYKGKYGIVFGNNCRDTKSNTNCLSTNRRFYVDGVDSIRGFNTQSISPANIGGNQMATSSIELSFGLIKAMKLRTSAFFDIGGVGKESINDIGRSSYGAQIEWFSPIGPVAFIFPQPFKKHKNDKVSHFKFNIGKKF